MFKNDTLKEILEIKERLEVLRQNFSDEHDQSPDKSFLKQELKQYLDCIPEIKSEKLEGLL